MRDLFNTYVYAHVFCEWVGARHDNVNMDDLYSIMMDNEYLEDSMGSRFTKGYCEDHVNQYPHYKYFIEFLNEFKLEEIQFRYGS